jgi:AraC family transcriptional regulator
MSYISQVNEGIEYIEANLAEDLSPADIARAASISQWHFQRIFSALTGETLKGYIRARRLSVALKRLLHTDRRIIEIAVECGYESQESFTRAFQQAFRMPPGEFRKRNQPHLFMEKVRIDRDYLRHISRNLTLLPELVELPARHFVGMHTQFFGVESEKNNMAEKLPELWGRFAPRKHEVVNGVPAVGYGLIRQNPDPAEGLDYFSAMEVKEVPARLPEAMVLIELPRQRCAKFLHRGPLANLNHTVNYIYSSWLLNSEYAHTYGPDLEEYGTRYHPTSPDSEIYYLIPVISEREKR